VSVENFRLAVDTSAHCGFVPLSLVRLILYNNDSIISDMKHSNLSRNNILLIQRYKSSKY